MLYSLIQLKVGATKRSFKQQTWLPASMSRPVISFSNMVDAGSNLLQGRGAYRKMPQLSNLVSICFPGIEKGYIFDGQGKEMV